MELLPEAIDKQGINTLTVVELLLLINRFGSSSCKGKELWERLPFAKAGLHMYKEGIYHSPLLDSDIEESPCISWAKNTIWECRSGCFFISSI